MNKNYYDILGVPQNSSEKDIKRAYFILANQYHPDKPNGSEKRFKEINEAYRILLYRDTRGKYDLELKSRERNNQHDSGQWVGREEQVNRTNPQKIDIERYKKNIINTGKSIYAIGWLEVAVSLVIIIINIVDKSAFNFRAFLIVLALIAKGTTFIVLSGRIKKLADINIKTYLQIILWLSIVLGALIAGNGGGYIGTLLLILVPFLIISIIKFNKLMLVKEFASKLSEVNYPSIFDYIEETEQKKTVEQGARVEVLTNAPTDAFDDKRISKIEYFVFLAVIGIILTSIFYFSLK